MSILFILLSFFISLAFACIIIPKILLISKRKRLYDMPSERKVHTKAIPRLGGVSFFPTIICSYCFVLTLRTITGYGLDPVQSIFMLPELLLLICGITLLYLVGIADDLVGVRYRQKFFVQTICAIFFPIAGLWINNLYGLFGLYEIPYWLGMPLTIFVVIFITNAINLIDGIDGLASGLSTVSLVVLGGLFIQDSLWAYAMLAFATVGVLIPFFYYNVFGSAERSRKIFMGDTGSLTLGYIISFLAIKYSQFNPLVTPFTDGAIIIAFSTLIVPAFDVVRVVIVRIKNGYSPFEPDKNHIHHKCLAMGMTARGSMIMILMLSCAFSILNIILINYININILLIVDVILWFLFNHTCNRKIKKKINDTK